MLFLLPRQAIKCGERTESERVQLQAVKDILIAAIPSQPSLRAMTKDRQTTLTRGLMATGRK